MNAAKQKSSSARVRSLKSAEVEVSDITPVEVVSDAEIVQMDSQKEFDKQIKAFDKALKAESDAILQSCLIGAQLYEKKDQREKWVEHCAKYKWKKTTTYERAYAGQVFAQLLDFGIPKDALPNFSQALELRKLDESDRIQVWHQLTDGSEKKVTLSAVKEAIAALEGSEPDRPLPPVQPTPVEVEDPIAAEPAADPVSFESVPDVCPMPFPVPVTGAIGSDEALGESIEVDEEDEEEDFGQSNFDAYTALKTVARQFSANNSLKWSETTIDRVTDRLYQDLVEMSV